MPTGLLIFCLDYAKKDTELLAGVFTSIRDRFADLANAALKELLDQFYEFRNTYIAHQKKELNDVETTRTALQVWTDTLQALHRAGR